MADSPVSGSYVLVTDTNQEWVSEVTGKPLAEVAQLFVDAEMREIVCSIKVP